jgi:glycosyltransferase involved in cell wall biosynthesis
MKTQPLISVIMPVFNCEKYIDQALTSIVNQSYANLEILICDDASNDRTLEILYSFKDARVKIFKNETNKGVVFTKNFLFKKARGEYFAMQDGDDYSHLDRLRLQLNEFLQDPSLSACTTNVFRISNLGKVSLYKENKSSYITLKNCYPLPCMPASLVIKREVFESVGGLHPYFSGLLAEDLYWIALIVERFKFKYINAPLYYYRFNDSSITNTFDRRDKLVVVDLICELIAQRVETGSDWIENKNTHAIQHFIKTKFSDRKWLAEKYRVMAAVQRDGKKRGVAFQLIWKAVKLNPFALTNYITLRYILS